MNGLKQITISLFLYVSLFLIVGCGVNKPTEDTSCVTKESPVITCISDTTITLGSEYSSFVSAVDPDNEPSELIYSLIDNAGFGDVSIDAATGEFTWTTMFDDYYKGVHTFIVVVTDGPCAEANADTCSFSVSVVNFLVAIERTHGTIQGQTETVEVNMHNSGFENYPMGGFDFLFQYDATALTFQSADPGQFITDCGWEYFTYIFNPNGDCGIDCPTDEIRVIALAETINGSGNHPTCFTNAGAVSNQLAVLNFLVTNDRTFECMYAPVEFIWYDCGDNTISDVSGDQLFISNHVFNFEDTLNWGNDSAANLPFPTKTGANSTCDTLSSQETLRFVDFINGGVEIVCADSI